METIGLQEWNNVHSRRSTPQREDPDQQRRHRSRGGRGRRRSQPCQSEHQHQPLINESTVMPPARATREVLHTLSQLQRLYMQQHQFAEADEQQHHQHIAALQREMAETRDRLLADAALKEQQELVNQHGLGPVSPARLRALTTQISTLYQRL